MSTNSSGDESKVTPAVQIALPHLHRTSLAQLRLAVQLATIAVAGFLAGQWFTRLFSSESAHIGGLWCVVSGIIALGTSRSETWDLSGRRVTGSLIGAVISGVVLLLVPFSLWSLALTVAITVLLCEIIGFTNSTKLATTTVVIIMVVSAEMPQMNPLLNAGLRFVESCIGVGLAMAVAVLSPKAESATEMIADSVRQVIR